MKTTLALLTLAIAAASNAAEPSRFQFVEVLEVSPQYSQAPCEGCDTIPDLRFNGTKFRYRCNDVLYENWIPKTMQVHVRIQVVDCSKVVITKDRKPIMENEKGSTDSDGNLFYTNSYRKE
ncbi:hypothetical protein H3H36_15665 [Duganella sp. FT3S]|uniref:Uncharacterized protein n=1 Tax=Rugamonas fusca TaxID=2758568 RepID=A0A7W2EJ60_9BURK|nr:hypothetical protein [Rugamonas fusca]MBA5606794.1 hypothetical protein [Rugamonas fusca]